MHKRGAWRNNVFVECGWRSMKYERVHRKANDSLRAARADITPYMDWFNLERLHSNLERFRPDATYLAGQSHLKPVA